MRNILILYAMSNMLYRLSMYATLENIKVDSTYASVYTAQDVNVPIQVDVHIDNTDSYVLHTFQPIVCWVS